jgi:autotransporter-associated beta strand protein
MLVVGKSSNGKSQMKTRLGIAKFALPLCSVFVTAAVFGQTTYTWTGESDGTNFGAPGNWNPVGLPDSCYRDTAQWDGMTTSNLFISFNFLPIGTSCNPPGGINIVLTSHQINSVDLYSPVAISSGERIAGISIATGAGPFSLGDNTLNALNLLMGETNGQVQNLVNNSANAATIYPNARWNFGGGGTHTLAFDGSGNWNVTNYLVTANGSTTLLTKSGSGTMFWTGASVPNDVPNGSFTSPLTVNGGSLVLNTANLLSSSMLGPITIVNNALVEYDEANAAPGTLSGPISGSGSIQVNNGTLTLSGQNTYTGSDLLTDGELIPGSAEIPGTSGPLGLGTITFAGGTLGYSVSNSFDYSLRFDPSPNQAYSIDTAGQNVTLATGLGSSGGTLAKLGAGTLTLSGTCTYSGLTTVSAGKLVFQGPKSGSGNITVSDGAALGIFATTSQTRPGTLTLGTGSSTTLEFYNINSTTIPPIAAGTLSATGIVTINVNSGSLSVGQYPLLTWTSGSAPTVSLGVLNGFVGNLSINGNSVELNITAILPVLSFALNGNNLQLWWPGSFKLQTRTNSLNGSNWWDYPGGGTSPVTITVAPWNESVFFRLFPVP